MQLHVVLQLGAQHHAMKQYDEMSHDELATQLAELKETLDEVTEEREMILFGTTGLHRTVTHLVEKYENELAELNEKIGYIEGLLGIGN